MYKVYLLYTKYFKCYFNTSKILTKSTMPNIILHTIPPKKEHILINKN